MSDPSFELSSGWSEPHQSHGFFHTCRDCGAEDSIWLTRKKEQIGSTSETETHVWLICDSCNTGWEKDGSDWVKPGEGDDTYTATDVINVPRGKNDHLFAKLIVPTQSSGATFTAKGWSVGGSHVQRTSASGEIRDEPYEKYVKKLTVDGERVEISVVDKKTDVWSPAGGGRTLRLSLADIINVDTEIIEGNSGFIIESDDDLYQFKLARKRLKSESHSDARDAVGEIIDALPSASEGTPFAEKPDSKNKNEDDAIDKLSRVKELYEDGVITESEFENKKAELLDQI